jgi:hypothetical protein
LCKMRQLTYMYSMGPEQMGIHIRAFKATTRSKDFTFGKPFVDYHKLYNIVLILCILLLCRFFIIIYLLFLTFIHMKEQEKTMQIRVFKRGGQRSTLLVGCRKKKKNISWLCHQSMHREKVEKG